MGTEEKSPFYDMGAVCQLTGLSPHVLRSWESRYGVVSPARQKNGRRAYSPEDLKHLQTLKTLVDHGHRIGTLAALDETELANRMCELYPGSDRAADQLKELGITVIGETLSRQCKRWVLAPPAVISADYRDFEAASSDSGQPGNPIVLFEYPTMQVERLSEVENRLEALGGKHALISYQFGPHARLLEQVGSATTLCRGVMNAGRLDAEIALLMREPAVQPETSTAVISRRFSREQLDQIAAMSNTIACECPRHLSTIVGQLTQFEDYSAECENLKPGDAELHRYLMETTARARNLMEQAMAKVMEQENIVV